jgi:hypothetical protein
MKPNIGTPDKIIRIILGIVLLVLLFVLDGWIRYIGLLGAVLIVTVFINFCPIYAIFGLSTRGQQPKS